MNLRPFTGFFGRRWRAETDLGVLFWRDLLVVGTLINLVATFAALALASQDIAMGIAVAVHFIPLPYNAFLLASVLRSPQRTAPLALTAWVWFGLMTLA